MGMKKLGILLLAVTFSLSAIAKKKVKGYYEKDGVRHEVTFNIQTTLTGKAQYIDGNSSVIYFDERGKKKSLTAETEDIVFYSYKGEDIIMHGKLLPSKGKKRKKEFCLLLADGKLKVYRSYYTKPSRSYVSARPYWEYIEKEGRLIKVNKLKIKQTVRTYVGTCPAAVSAMKKYKVKLDLTASYVADIINIYNAECGDK